MAGISGITGEPISSTQVERTADILIAHSKRPPQGLPQAGVDWRTLDWPAARAQLTDVLSPSQIATLGIFVERDKLREQVTQRTNVLTAQFKKQPATK